MRRVNWLLAGIAVLELVAIIATTAHAGTAVVPIAVDTCLDSPPVAPLATYSACKKGGAGPSVSTAMVRTQAVSGGGQDWESWATLASSRMVCMWQVNAPCAWVTKAAVIQQCATAACSSGIIAAPPVPTPPPTPTPTPGTTQGATQTQTLTWTAPTQNTDGSALTDLAGFNIYQGTSPTSLSKVATVAPGVLSWVTPPLGAGTYYFAVTAFNSATPAQESARSGVVQDTIAAVVLVPAAPTNVQVQATTAH